jgi:hypothetical protein
LANAYTYETGFAQCLFKLILGGRFVFFLEHGFQDYVAFVFALEICVPDTFSWEETVMIGIHIC